MRTAEEHTVPAAALKRFQRFGFITVGLVFLVVLAGGIVRTTGAGMGCPDWPRCFGHVIPPTDVSQLPPDYKTRFAVQGREIADFSATKTWIEYANRLVGALSGVFVALTLATSFFIRKPYPLSFWLSLAGFILIGFVGWLGAVLVSKNLAPGMVTVHMLVALLVVFVLLTAVFGTVISAEPGKVQPSKSQLGLAALLLVLSLVQLVLGTRVREAVDQIAVPLNYAGRAHWIDQLGLPYYIHRSFSILLVLGHLALWRYSRVLFAADSFFKKTFFLSSIFLAINILMGVLLAYAGFPAWVQPLHLLLAFGLITTCYLCLWRLTAASRVARQSSTVHPATTR